jgi:ABC-type phosphate/phosphonate transport system substrate-binding protein
MMESAIMVSIVEDDLAARSLLRSREAEAAVLDPVSYLAYGPGISIVAIMENYGEPYSRFSLIVPGASIFHRLPDLHSPRVAFRGPSSGIARTYAFAWAHTLGAFPGGIREEILLDSFESILRAVALAEVDAGFVPTAFMETLRGSVLLEGVRELASSPRIPLALLVFRDDLNQQRKELVLSCARYMASNATPGLVSFPDERLPGILTSIAETLGAAAR